MARPFRVVWQEDAATLHRLYQQEHDGPLRSRLHALWLLRQGRSLQETAATVGVAYRTVQQWLAWYRTRGVTEVRRHRKGGRGQRARLSAAQQGQLLAHIATGACYTAQDAISWLRAQFGVTYTLSGMYDLLRRQGVRPKVPRPLNPKSSPEAQAAWKKGGLRRRLGTRA